MKKLLTVVCLSGLLSVPSVVFAEASWYGSLRSGIKASGTTGVSDGGSRWGIKGSSEVSEGLTAVYRFEHKMSTEDASQPGGRLAYVGLSGGFGTLTIGQIWSASYNSFGAITDNSTFLGDSETSYRNGNSVSYAVSVENISIQADAIMNNGWGKGSSAAKAAVAAHGGRAAGDSNVGKHGAALAGAAAPEDDNVDQFELGVSMGLGESAKIAFAHKSYDTGEDAKTKSNWVAGQYTIGSMTAYLGVGQTKTADSSKVGTAHTNDADNAAFVYSEHKETNSTTFAGVRGSVGDTGVSYVFQARSKKSKGTNGGTPACAAVDVTEYRCAKVSDAVAPGSDIDQGKTTPWFLGLSRSLGGGASVHFEHSDPDDGEKSTSYLALKIDF